MKKSDLIEKIKRRLGYPIVKIELDDMQITDHIDYARTKFIKWAVGQATQEYYFTQMLIGGQEDYDMPSGTISIIGYDISSTGGINTLFTMENYLYNAGMFNSVINGDSGYNLVSYHIARDFLDTIKRYTVDAYNFRYNQFTNILTINPVPPTGSSLTVSGVTYDSPGFILIRSYKTVGENADLYENLWVQDYVTALCKKTLGMIRRKFANFTSIGNTGIALDGDSLMSEADTAIEKLEEELRLEETFEGGEILIG